jgi:hypothetical protein
LAVSALVGYLFGSAVNSTVIGMLAGTLVSAGSFVNRKVENVKVCSESDVDQTLTATTVELLLKTVAVIGAVATFGVSPKNPLNTNFIARCKNVGAVATTWNKVRDGLAKFIELIPVVLYELWMFRNPLVAIHLSMCPDQVYEDIHVLCAKWLNDKDELVPSTFLEAAGDEKIRRQVMEIIERGRKMRSYIRDHSVEKMMRCETFKRFDRELDRMGEVYSLCVSLTVNEAPRIDPFVIHLSGDSGIGKSNLLQILPTYIFGKKVGQYTRNSSSDYWDGYKANSHPVVIFTDFMQVVSPNSKQNDASELMNMVNPTSWMLPMASLDPKSPAGCKGETFGSPLVLLASNYPIPAKPDNVMSHEALLRRRICVLKLFYTTRVSMLSRKAGKLLVVPIGMLLREIFLGIHMRLMNLLNFPVFKKNSQIALGQEGISRSLWIMFVNLLYST